MVIHKFGGKWTEIKLEKISKYLSFYSTALKKQKFKLWYIDGFAGTGAIAIEKYKNNKEISNSTKLALSENSKCENTKEISGSAKIALDVKDKFDMYVFIDNKPSHIKQLNNLVKDYKKQGLCISIIKNDFNNEIVNLVNSINKNDFNRAIIFLDPYGMEVEWNTIKLIAETQKVDLWYLFPIEGANRQLSNNKNRVDNDKINSLNKLLGTNEWINNWYKPNPQGSLFGNEEEIKNTNKQGIEDFVKNRLEGIFAKVMKPYRLYGDKDEHKFSLFCCISNPAPKAFGLAQKAANHILKD